MFRAAIIFFALAAIVLCPSAQGQTDCPPNQEYTTCGSACPPSCNSQPNQACTMQCIMGCQCKSGYLLNSAGTACVLPSEC